MPASNTREAFADFVGQRVVGVLFGALPVRDRRIAVASKTLVFEDGRGYYASVYLGEDLPREEAEARMDELLGLERVA